MKLSGPSSVLTAGTLGGLTLQKLAKGNPYNSKKLREIHTLETSLLGIASIQYGITLPMEYHRAQRWRFFDWIITTPLLLKTLHSLAEEKEFEESFIPALTANLVMIIAGYYAEFVAKTEYARKIWYLIGVIALIVVLVYVYRWDSFLKDKGVDTKNLSTFFYVGWTIYGLNFLNPNEELRQTGFNVLDLFNKGIYSLHLTEVIEGL